MGFDVDSARKAGYSDGEIAEYLGKQSNFDVAAAQKAGYNPSEIVGFLNDRATGTGSGGSDRAARIAEMNSVTDPTDPNYSPLTDNAQAAIQAEARGQMDASRSRYPGRVLDSSIPDATIGSVARDAAAGALQIGPTALEGVGQLARLASGDTVGKGLTDLADRGMQSIREVVGSERGNLQRKRFEQDMADPQLNAADVIASNPGALADQALPQVGSMALPAGAAKVAGEAANAGRAAKLAAAIDEGAALERANKIREAAAIGTVAAQNASDSFSTIRDKGGDLPKAYAGAGMTVPFSLAAGKLTGGGAEGEIARMIGGKSAAGGARAALAAAGKEGAQEVGEQIGQNIGEMYGTGAEFDPNDFTKQIAVAGTLGAAMGGGVHTVGGLHGAEQAAASTEPAAPSSPETSAADMMVARGFSQANPAAAIQAIGAAQSVDEAISAAQAAVQPSVATDVQSAAATAARIRELEGQTDPAPAAPAESSATDPIAQELASDYGLALDNKSLPATNDVAQTPSEIAPQQADPAQAVQALAPDQLLRMAQDPTHPLADAAASRLRTLETEAAYRQRDAEQSSQRADEERALLNEARDQQIAQADATTAAATPDAPSAMQLAFQNAKPLKSRVAQAAPVSEAATAIQAPAAPAFPSRLEKAGTLRVEGNPSAIRQHLAEFGVTKMIPAKGGMVIGKSQATRAQAALQQAPAAPSAPAGPDPEIQRAREVSASIDAAMANLPKMDAATAQQLRDDYASAKRNKSMPANNARAAARQKNPLRAFLGEHGIALDLKREFAPGRTEQRSAMVQGYGPIFRKSGLQMDELAQRAVEEGFLTEPDVAQLESLIDEAMSGRRVVPQYAQGSIEEEMRARDERARQDYEDAKAAEAEAEAANNAEIDAALDAAFSDPSRIITDPAAQMRAMGFTEQEIADELAQGSSQPQESGQGDSGSGQAVAARPEEVHARAQAQAQPDATAELPDALTSPSVDDILAQQDQAERGNRAETERRRVDEQRAAADAQRDEFGLTGSNRAADADPNQGAMFSRSKKAEQTETPEFKRWFAGSKVVNADGKPLVVYHGTKSDITEFSRASIGSATDEGFLGDGFYFTDNAKAAGGYAKGEGGNVIPAYVSIKTPYYADGLLPDYLTAESLQESGYDGVIYKTDGQGDYSEFVAFHPEQIKSATGNNGQFDPANPDIRYSRSSDLKAEKLAAKAAAAEQKRDAAFRAWSYDAPLVTSAAAATYPFATGQKIVVDAFHGTKRPDRIAGVFDPRRATSGPMAFFTSSPELASHYATGKSDTSLADEDQAYANWFRFKPDGARSDTSIDRAWSFLTPEQRATVRERMPDIRLDDDGNVIYEKGGGDIGGYQWELQQTQRGYDRGGNPLKAAVETWLTSGTLFDDELKFLDVLRQAGMPMKQVEADFPTDEFPSVYKTFIVMRKPLVVSDIPAEVMSALEEKAKTDRSRPQPGADSWDKRSRTIRDWVAHVKGQDGRDAAYAWTSIPDKVTDVLKSFGYDGIVDWSGKGGGHQHPVYIPFASTQVKGAFNRGTFDPTKKDINFSRDANGQVDAAGNGAAQIQQAVDALTAKWKRAPDVKVLASMRDAPDRVRQEWERQDSQGAAGEIEGFFYKGKVYIVADAMKSDGDVARVLFHEALGHYGLRNVFGNSLTPVLEQVAKARPELLSAKAEQYGLDLKRPGDRMVAAEEVLAELAQTRPNISFVKQAIAAIRNWLRENVPAFRNMAMSDADIIQRFILPARNWVERGSSSKDGAVSLSQAKAQPEMGNRAAASMAEVFPDAAFQRGVGGQTETPEFKRWFAGSKVVDAEGKPLRVYHGTQARSDFTEFNGVSFFTPDATYANRFGNIERGRVMPAYVSLQNPLDARELGSAPITTGRLLEFLGKRGVQLPADLEQSLRSDSGVDEWWYHFRTAPDFKNAIEAAGYDGLIQQESVQGHVADAYVSFKPEQIKSATGNNGQFDPANPDIRFSRSQQPNAHSSQTWATPEASRTDRIIYELQDQKIDLKRVQESIKAANRTIEDRFDARTAESLYPGRVAERSKAFLNIEVKPLLQAMATNKVSMDELADFLHARGAQERNEQIAKVNPDMPDGGAGTNSKGTLLTTAAANAYLADIPADRRATLNNLAAKVDAITAGTRQLLVSEGLEKAETVAAWEGAYKNYVPMFRDEADSGVPHPTGSGFSVKGGNSKRATGSEKQVTNILAHVLMQRDAAVTRAEKNRVGLALYGLALSNPNPKFWTTIRPGMQAAQIGRELEAMGVDPVAAEAGMGGVPTVRTVDPVLDRVVDRPNPMYKNMPGALVLKLGGEDRVLMLNEKDERALRMATALKNLDGLTRFDLAGSIIGKTTRWLAAVNTQYNPAFGLVNGVRDTFGGAVNLSSTPLRGQAMKVLGNAYGPAWIGIAKEIAGKGDGNEWSQLYRQFEEDGGKTGYREMFRTADDRTKRIEADLKHFASEGKLTPRNAAHAVLDLLDGFNTTIENAVRLSAYKAALDSGISRPAAALIGRELTVDFNRKGRIGREAGPLYAFFNASVQGTARTLDAIKGPAGAKIIAGGVALGVIQALLLASAGYDDDEIPDFVKTRAFIIPLPGTEKKYVAIPLPLGLHVLPNTGRVLTELALNGGRDIGKKVFDATGEIAGAFSPLGGGNITTPDGALRTLAPSVIDPIIELGFNKNFAGNQIERDARGQSDPRPGFQRARESTLRSTTGQVYLGISKAINTMMGGSDYEAGLASPTPERVQYIAGVVGGGLLREMEKTVNLTSTVSEGDKVASNKVPIAGRFYGQVDDDAVQKSRYFDASRKMDMAQAAFRAASKAGDEKAIEKISKEYPELAMGAAQNRVASQIQKLNKLAATTINDRATLKEIDQARISEMKELNVAMRQLERSSRAPTYAEQIKGRDQSTVTAGAQ